MPHMSVPVIGKLGTSMIVKGFQFIGLLFPIFVVALGKYFFRDISADTPLYAGAAVTMGFYGMLVIVFAVYSITVIPTSLILLEKQNREHFRFKSVGWRAVMYFNWAVIAICGLCVFLIAVLSFIKTLM